MIRTIPSTSRRRPSRDIARGLTGWEISRQFREGG